MPVAHTVGRCENAVSFPSTLNLNPASSSHLSGDALTASTPAAACWNSLQAEREAHSLPDTRLIADTPSRNYR